MELHLGNAAGRRLVRALGHALATILINVIFVLALVLVAPYVAVQNAYERWVAWRSRRALTLALFWREPLTAFDLAYVWRPNADDPLRVAEERIVGHALKDLERRGLARTVGPPVYHERGFGRVPRYALTDAGVATLRPSLLVSEATGLMR